MAARRATSVELEAGQRLCESLIVRGTISSGPETDLYEVWSSRDLCVYACKVLKQKMSQSSEAFRGISRERAILGRLAHPYIVRVYASDPGLERPHILMDYLPGPTLLEVLGKAPRRRLPVLEAVRISLQIGGALSHLHSKGFLYRDMKPANVVERDGSFVMIDFGSADKYRPGRAPRRRVGTDPYMAPEQCLNETLSPATDVYGLGAVLFEMLTGQWPFEERLMSTFDRSRLENRFPQIKYEPDSLRRRAPHVDDTIAAIVRRCLATDPTERYQQAEVVVAELGEAIAGDVSRIGTISAA